MTRKVAAVYVESAVYAIDKPFSYLVPPEMEETLRRGCRVLVPFGRSNQKVQGLVAGIEETDASRLKPVALQLDREPVIDGEFFRIIEFLVTNTFCTWYEAVRAVLPIGSNVDVTEIFQLTPVGEEKQPGLPQAEARIVEYLRSPKMARELKAFLECRGNPERSAAVKSLMEKGLVEKSDKIRQKVARKTIRMVRLSREGALPPLPAKQQSVADLLQKVGEAQVKELCYLCGVTEGVLRTLVKKGLAVCFDREVSLPEIPVGQEKETCTTESLSDIELAPAQQAAFDGILELTRRETPQAALLYGVTGSGKTQVYIKLIEQILAEGRTAMMLVPEIALTPQMVGKFEALFGGITAVIHSSLTPAERLNEYHRIRSGQARIVIGTRSAVFAPLKNIGIIILDEEGESSYKSDSAPRYHARDVAKLRCVMHKGLLLLGSATPSVDSYYHARQGSYSLFTLEERYARSNLPHVYLVDMLEEERKQNLSPVSMILQEQLKLNLQAGEQSILLINRRGYHTYATCMQCGQVIKCPYCDVAMTYHKANGRLMCHTCGHTELFESRCPACHGEYIKLTGAGTQKLEDELGRILPGARLLRMDTDTTYSRFSYEKNFDAFRRGQYDILLGTQMIAKGLDFPNVTLVGVIGADSGLYSSDYRSGERIFSLITQVVGRSGRSEKPGRAYIQTFDTANPVINFAARQDYPAFYEDEIAVRRAILCPPFCDIVLLGFASPREEAAQAAAMRAIALLKEESSGREGIALKVLGAAPAAIYKVSGKYRYRVVIKCRLNPRLKEILSSVLRRCGAEKVFSNVTVTADVNGEMN